MIGHVLTNAPSDPSGLWIHKTVASILNDKDASDMRNGYRTTLFNSRGVFHFTAGRAEKELAQQYREQAEAVDAEGFSRLAGTIRELSSSYDKDAERAASRDEMDD